MTPEEKSLLQRTYSLAEENNKILHSMRRGARWSNVFRVIYWIIIIGISVGAYYIVQPYIDLMMSYLHVLTGTIDSASSTAQSLQKVLGTFPSSQ